MQERTRPPREADTHVRPDPVATDGAGNESAGERPERVDEGGGDARGGPSFSARLLAWLIAVAIVAAAAFWWFTTSPQPLFGLLGGTGEEQGGGDGGAKKGRGRQGPIQVETVTLRTAVVPEFLDYTGTTEALRRVVIRPRVSGYLVARPFEEGTRVEKGQLLYRIDTRELQNTLQSAIARRDSQEVAVALAEARLARLDRLADRDFASQANLDEAQSELAQAKARVRELETEIAAARLNLEFATVEAPFAGEIGFSQADVGELVEAGAALTDLVSVDPIYVSFRPSERELPRFEAARAASNEPLRVEVTQSNGAQVAAPAALEQIENEISTVTGTIEARAVLPNSDAGLAPGQFVRVRLILGEAETILVPTEALVTDQGRRIVYLFDDGTARRVEVRTGDIYGDRTRILEGLEAGDELIVNNLQRVRGNADVTRSEPDGNAEAASGTGAP